MSSMQDNRWESPNSRAADSAQCLLVVGGYAKHAGFLDRTVNKAKDRIEMSPSMVDFFDIRFVDMGLRPGPSDDVLPGVARLALEFTSRPGDSASNFSALIVIDSNASMIDRVFNKCLENPVMRRLDARYLGLASGGDPGQLQPLPDGMRIIISPEEVQTGDEIIGNILREAEFLFHDFGTRGEQGVTGTSLTAIGSAAEPGLRRVIAADDEAAAVKVREAENHRQAELLRQAEVRRRQAEDRLRQAEEQRLAARQAEVKRRHADEERRRDEERHREEKARQQAVSPRDEVLEEQPSVETTPNPAPSTLDPAPESESKPESGDGGQPAATAPVQSSSAGSPKRAIPDALPAVRSIVEASIAGLRRARPSSGSTEERLDSVDPAEMLRRCSVLVERGQYKAVNALMPVLRSYAAGEISPDAQRRLREIVLRDGLLRPDPALAALDGQFYDVVLQLAFGAPFDYPRYWDLEKCLAVYGDYGALPRRRSVLEAVNRIGATDIRVLALVRYLLGPERLDRWFRRDMDVRGLITALAADEWAITEHADIAFKVTHLYLRTLGKRDDRRPLVAALRENAYLAGTMLARYPNSMAGQVTELTSFLQAAYPRGLDRPDIAEVFDAGVPTPALARAVLRTMSHRGDEYVVVRAFARKLGYEEFDAVQESELLKLLKAS